MALMDMIVKLRADNAQLKSGLAEGAAASRNFAGSVERNNNKLASSFKALGAAVAAAYAAKKVVDFANTIIAKANAQERAMAKLQAVVVATGMASGFSAAQMAAHAAELQKVTTYGDENIIAMQSVLATFKSISGEVFNRTTKAILDLSTIMGQDLKSSAVQVGKAIEDPIKGLSALSRVGVTFTQTEKDMITSLVESNEKLKAQEIILQALEGQFGGASEALRGTFGGAVDAASNSWGDFLEEIGKFATESDGLIAVIEDVNTALQTMAETLKTIRGFMQTSGVSLSDFIGPALPPGLRELFLLSKSQKETLPEKTIGTPGKPAMTFRKSAGPSSVAVDPETFGMSPTLIDAQMHNLNLWSAGFHDVYAQTLDDGLNASLKFAEAESQTWKMKFDAADNFYDALEARSHMWVEANGGMWQQVANTTINVFGEMVSGFGDAVAQALVYGKDLDDMLKSLGEQILSSVISAGIQIGIMSLFGMPLGGKGILGAFHTGGTVPSDGPYMLQRGETVRTPGQERSLLREAPSLQPIILQLNHRELGRVFVDLRRDGLMQSGGKTFGLQPV